MKRTTQALFVSLLLAGWVILPTASGQVTNVVFTGDFSSLNTNQFIVGHFSQEGGGPSGGQILPQVSNGTCEIMGTTTEQWWAGGDLQIKQVFPANPETNVVFSINRVSMTGSTTTGGTATAIRSEVCVFDPSLTYYILLGENWTEDYWQYNQKVGLSSDVPTGGGTAIAAFNATSEDESSHIMSIVCDGATASLYLDGVLGVTAPFPFSQVAFLFGAEARADLDTVDVVYSGLTVQTVGFEAFSPAAATLVLGHSSSNVVVRIPPGANKTQAVHVTVTSDTPGVAIPSGAVNGAVTLTFPAGGANEQTLGIQSVAVGGAIFSMSNDINMGSANSLEVAVVLGPGVRLTENFSGTALNTNVWQVDNNGFETTGVGTFSVSVGGNTLNLSGTCNQMSYWPGIAIETVNAFTATPELPLAFDMDRLYVDVISPLTFINDTGARTGVYITTAGRSPTNAANRYVFFGQDYGETGWEVNVNPGTPTGAGTSISQFTSLNDTNKHHLRLLADGSQVQVFVDGQSGGAYPFAATAGVRFEIGAYARAVGDAIEGDFANVQIANILPPITVSPVTIETQSGVNTNVLTVTVPSLRTTNIAVTITSQNPSVAVPQGAVNGVLTLQFPSGAANVQTFNLVAAGIGQTSLVITNNQASPITGSSVALTVTSPLMVWFSDKFTSSVLNANYWNLSTNSPGVDNTLTNSFVSTTNGLLEMYADAVASATSYLWAGYGLYMTTLYNASVLSPIVFEVDRTAMTPTLVGGNITLEWTGVWVLAPDTNYVWFGDYDTHMGQAGGWEYFDSIGATTNSPLAGVGVVLSAFSPPAFNDLGNHHIKVEVNGSVVEFFVDGIYGGSAPFPYTNGISFGLGSYVDTANGLGTILDAYFANVTVSGPGAGHVTLGPLTITRQANGTFVISWTGPGTLQSSSSLTSGWSDVTPAPTGTTYTVTPSGKPGQFFRLRQ